jgi:mono/diheme cytochrome c family protein/uncharacterized membrane protein
MAIIVAILSFMMDPGSWIERRTFLSGFLNPIYLPQLAFRTTLAMVMGGACALTLAGLFIPKKDLAFRMRAFRQIARWTLVWTPACVFAAWYYWHNIPDTMQRHFGVAIATQSFSEWHQWLLILMLTAFGLVFLSLIWSSLGSESFVVPKWVGVPSFLLLLLFLGSFERVREFIRKPYAISGYMYANGIRVQDYPLLQKEGILKYATYTSVKTITPDNKILAGKELFKLTCSRCHTLNGINSIRSQLRRMYGDKPWQSDNIAAYIGTMHTSRTYMPPFPGNEAEKQALGHYLVSIQQGGELSGDQTEGISRIKALAPQLVQAGGQK